MGSLRWHDSWTGLCLILATSADKTARVAGRETLFLCGYKIPVRSGPAAFGRPWREISGAKILIRTITAVAALCALSSMAEARVRGPAVSPECNVTMPCIGVDNPIHARQRARRGAEPAFSMIESSPRLSRRQQRALARAERNASEPVAPRAAAAARASEGYSAGLVGPLAAKLASIQAACPGTQAISGVRHTRIAGTRRMSLHAQGKAVDVRGPYGCIYAQLKDWSGGYSTDSGRVQHIHISYDVAGGREMGLRFAHGGGRRSWRSAYARMR